MDRWFASSGLLKPIPRGDKCALPPCASPGLGAVPGRGDGYAVFLEDDVRLAPGGRRACWSASGWVPSAVPRVVEAGTNYGRLASACCFWMIFAPWARISKLRARDAVAPYRGSGCPFCRGAAPTICCGAGALSACHGDYLLFNPDNCFYRGVPHDAAALAVGAGARARQPAEFVGVQNPISSTRPRACALSDWTYV